MTTTSAKFTKSEIFSIYNKLKSLARKDGDLKKIDRLNKALGILMSNSYYSGDKKNYSPTSFTCGCKDWEFHHAARRGYTGPCKHMLTETMIEMIMERRETHNVSAKPAEIVASFKHKYILF